LLHSHTQAPDERDKGQGTRDKRAERQQKE